MVVNPELISVIFIDHG